MPVVVVALAASSFVGAAAAATAIGATMATMVAAGAVMVGSALTIVGTITGNAKLTKIGAIVGLVGGIGGAVAGAMEGASAAASAAGEAGADAAAGGIADAATAAAGDAIETSAVDLGTDGITSMAGDAAGSAATDVGGGLVKDAAGAAGSVTPAPDSLLASATPAAAPVPAAGAQNVTLSGTGNVANDAGKAAFDTSQTSVGQSLNGTPFKTDVAAPWQGAHSDSLLGSVESSGMPAPAMPAVPAPSGMLGQLGQYGSDLQAWAKANPMLAKAALEGTGALVKGMAPPTDAEKAQMAYYKAQTDAQNRRALWGSGRTV